MTTTETELEKSLCAIAYKAYKLLPDDYHPLLWVYKQQRDLKIWLDLLEKAGADEELLDELRCEYRIAHSRYLHAMQEEVYGQKYD